MMFDSDAGVNAGGSSMVVVSNRLPVVLERGDGNEWDAKPGSGGLVTALEPVLRRDRGIWVGWPGIEVDDLREVQGVLDREAGSRKYDLRAIGLSEEEREGFYLGFANQVIWPLFHGFPERCNFLPRYWDTYREVNRKFAVGISEHLEGEELIWVHDYHLMGVAERLREMGIRRQPIAFFLHTPFPSLEMLRKLPWRLPVLRSLLCYDLIGFQTGRDRETFVHALRCLLPDRPIVRNEELIRVDSGTRTTDLGVFPISIDFREFADEAAKDSVREEVDRIRRALPGAKEDPDSHVLLLGVDRLDYTKGLLQKLKGFQLALRRHPELQGKATLIQLVVPSREDIPVYDSLKDQIDRLVGEICGEFSESGWTPVRYEYGRWSREQLLAHYRVSRVALVTPLKDGMNLVSKEYCAASIDHEGVLVLSEHAGSAAQLHSDALLVNPYQLEELASTIYRACTMDPVERQARMRGLREAVRKEDIHWWAESFLQAARSGRGRSVERRGRYSSPLTDPSLRGVRRQERSTSIPRRTERHSTHEEDQDE